MLKLHFLGRGAAFYPAFRNTNAYFEKDRDLYFLDFGESAFGQVAASLPLKDYENIYVLLTHLHADHSGSLASLTSYLYFVLHKRVTIIHPEETVVQLLTLQGIAPECYQYLPRLPEETGIQAIPIPVQHALDIHAFGYRLTCDGETLYYSGDSAQLPQDVLEDFLSGKVQHIYHDTASHPSESHCYFQRLVDAIPQAERRRVSCMHLDCDMVDELQRLGFRVVECFDQEQPEAK